MVAATTSDAAREAIVDSVAGQRGYATGWSVQATDRDAIAALQTSAAATGVAVTQTRLRTAQSDAQVTLYLRSRRQPPIYTLTDGAFPTSASEIALSSVAARELGVDIGGRIRVRLADGPREPRVVGLLVDPADTSRPLALMTLPKLGGITANHWLLPRSPDQIPGVRQYSAKSQLTASSTATAIENRLAAPSATLSRLRYLPLGLGVIGGILVLTVAGALTPSARETVLALIAAGTSPKQAWLTIRQAAGFALLGGVTLGATAAVVMTKTSSSVLAAALGQHWSIVPIPTIALLLIFVAPLVLSALPTSLFRGIQSILARPTRAQRGDGTRAAEVGTLIAFAGFVLVAWAYFQPGVNTANRYGLLAIPGSLMIALGVREAAAWGLRWRATPAVRMAAATIDRRLRPIWILSLLFAATVAIYSALITHDANAIETLAEPEQPAGSLLVYEIPDQAADELTQQYKAAGGKDIERYELVTSSLGELRATTEQLSSCVAAGGTVTACLEAEPSAAISGIAFGAAPDQTLRADASLVSSDRVGLLLFGEDGTVRTAKSASAEPDLSLGGNLPSLLIPPAHSLADEYQLTPSGMAELAFLDFSQMSDRDAVAFRNTLAAIAPAAQVSDTTSAATPREVELAQARLVALIGAALTVLAGVAAGATALIAYRQLRWVATAFGSSWKARATLSARSFGSALVGPLAAVAVVPIAVRVAGVPAAGDLGWIWAGPLVAMAACAGITMIGVMKSPRDDRDL